MFTGIVKEVAAVKNIRASGSIKRIEVGSSKLYRNAGPGDSISVSGVCLTVVGRSGGTLVFDMTEETGRRSNLGGLKDGDFVNLEDSMKPDGSLGGHFVLGHVDCVGTITDMRKSGECAVSVGFPKQFSHLIVLKGSVALDGVSLTVGEAGNGSLKAFLIPYTLENTTLGRKGRGGALNVEFDIVGKYVARMKELGGRQGITEDFLREKGF